MNAFATSYAPDSAVSQSWLQLWHRIEGRAVESVSNVATHCALDPLDLKLRSLLHLPRFNAVDLQKPDVIHEEIRRLAQFTVELQRGFFAWRLVEPLGTLRRAEADIREVPEETARTIHERFHYLASYHAGRHFGLYCDDKPVPAALATFSKMDVRKLEKYVSMSTLSESQLLSRVFAFRWAPRNSISYLLASAIRRMYMEDGIRTFVTWVNINLGFSASSYRSSNWKLCGSESVKYHYISGNYVSARALFDDTGIKPFQVQLSQCDLAPLQVWRYSAPR